MADPNQNLQSDIVHRDADGLVAALPPLLAEAERLAATVILGFHGRRRAGHGESFWQYRRAMPGDTLRDIDWRRSARSDRLYVRETEWEVAQSVYLWVDRSAAMTYRGTPDVPTKVERAALLALAVAVLLNRGGERFGLMGGPAEPPRSGRAQLEQVADLICRVANETEYDAPPLTRFNSGSRALFFSDFLGPRENLIHQVTQAADQGVKGCIIQILDPTEESFPFDGRVRFTSMGGGLRYETDRARALKPAYQAKLEDRKAALKDLAQRTGWLYRCHHTDEPPRAALLWAYAALEGFRL